MEGDGSAFGDYINRMSVDGRSAITTLRRFLVIQALMVWQGGFFFYAAVVVPMGTDEHGALGQGRVTRHVTDWLNAIGAAALLVIAWDQLANRDSPGLRRARWLLWLVMAVGLLGLVILHPRIEPYIDTGMEYREFYFLHRVYLYVTTVQWAASLVYVVLMLRAWNATPRAA